MERRLWIVGAALFALVGVLGWMFPKTVFGADYVIGQESKQLLETAAIQGDGTNVALYYLGKVYLNEGRLREAAVAWERYLAGAPDGEQSEAVREQLTVLKMKLAAEFAREAAQGRASPDGPPDANTLAVLDFRAEGDERVRLLSRGLTAMIITDLSKVEGLTLVEREKMSMLIKEFKLANSGLVERKTAMKIGRFLLARHIVKGTISAKEENRVDMSSKVIETINATMLGGQRVVDEMAQFFEIERKIVRGVLAALGYEELPPELKKALEKPHTKDLEALFQYARGLELMDAGEFDQAREAFTDAVGIDPAFGLAQEALEAAPEISTIDGAGEIDLLEYALVDDVVVVDAPEESVGPGDVGAVALNDITVVDAAQDDAVVAAMEWGDENGTGPTELEELPSFPEKPTPGEREDLPGFPGGPAAVRLGEMKVR